MASYDLAYIVNMTLTINSTADCDVVIRAYEFRNIRLGAVNRVRTANFLQGNYLTVDATDASQVMLNNITYNEINIFLANTSNMILWGSAERMNATQLGTGTIDARSLSSNYVTVFTNNSGLVKVKSNDYLSVLVNGLSDIIWCAAHGDIKIQGAEKYIPPNLIYYYE
ncbi:hypothetical protein I4U23_020745 [Adineta vaga]|nr:hypothetical protein I4U23_020745 [Adineta vaga]